MNTFMNVHPNFRLNGKLFTSIDVLLEFSKDISSEVHLFLIDWFNDQDFITVKTSGSTGVAKSIQLKKEFMVNSAKATGTFFHLYQDTTALLCMSVGFIAGKMMLVRAMVLGWHLDVLKPSANPLCQITKTYDFSAMVPLQLKASLKELHKIKKIIVGGAAVNNDLKNKLEHLSTEIFSTYGMTETITHVAVKKLNKIAAEKKDSSYYKTLPNVSVDIDERGCLVINAPKISTEKIITNDIVKLYSNTTFAWLGRYDTIINSGGIKLNPETIEEKLAEIIKNRFFVTGIPDKVLGEKLILIIEGSFEKKELFTLKEKISKLHFLEKYEKPKEILNALKFVETATKKIHRKKTLNLVLG